MKTITNMAHHVNRIILVIVIAISFNQAHAQKKGWCPEFKTSKLHPMRKTELNLSEFLQQDVPHINLNKECKISVAFFYFRVNNVGEIDSIHYDHDVLSEDMSKKIVDNIYKTEKQWKIPVNTQKSDFCWFIYPFIDMGLGSNCVGKEKELQFNFLRLFQLQAQLKPVSETINKGYFLIAPVERGDLFQRE